MNQLILDLLATTDIAGEVKCPLEIQLVRGQFVILGHVFNLLRIKVVHHCDRVWPIHFLGKFILCIYVFGVVAIAFHLAVVPMYCGQLDKAVPWVPSSSNQTASVVICSSQPSNIISVACRTEIHFIRKGAAQYETRATVKRSLDNSPISVFDRVLDRRCSRVPSLRSVETSLFECAVTGLAGEERRHRRVLPVKQILQSIQIDESIFVTNVVPLSVWVCIDERLEASPKVAKAFAVGLQDKASWQVGENRTMDCTPVFWTARYHADCDVLKPTTAVGRNENNMRRWYERYLPEQQRILLEAVGLDDEEREGKGPDTER